MIRRYTIHVCRRQRRSAQIFGLEIDMHNIHHGGGLGGEGKTLPAPTTCGQSVQLLRGGYLDAAGARTP